MSIVWTSAISDLRANLSDGDQDKNYYRKRCLGEINGTNTNFKTFEFRRVTDFVSATAPLGVWLDGSLLPASGISVDYPDSGDFTLLSAPADGSVLEASYYARWFIDSELVQFLTTASQWLSFGSDYTQVAEAFRPAALKYAASEAYQKLVIRWALRASDTFLLNDAPATENMGKMIDQYKQIALDYRKDAEVIRDDFYSRSGQQKQPLWGFNLGSVRDNVPKR
jgi:hypothetical protein